MVMVGTARSIGCVLLLLLLLLLLLVLRGKEEGLMRDIWQRRAHICSMSVPPCFSIRKDFSPLR